MIDTDVERGTFWPPRDKYVMVDTPGGGRDMKVIYELTDDDCTELFIIHRFAKKHGWIGQQQPDSDFVRQVKIKLGISTETT